MATIPSLRTWASGERITGLKLNEIRDALNFAYNPPRAHIASSAGVVLPNGVATRLTFDNVFSDTDNMWNSPGRMSFQTAGRFRQIVAVYLPVSSSYTQIDVDIRLNSGGSATGGTNLRTWTNDLIGGGQLMYPFERDMSVGDYIEVFVTQTSGASRTTTPFSLATFHMAEWFSQ